VDQGEEKTCSGREIDRITGLPRRKAFLESLDGVIRDQSDETLQRLWLGSMQLPVLQYLRSTECHEAQGYYFSPPLAPEDIPGFLGGTRSDP